jgi:hypothetical protein
MSLTRVITVHCDGCGAWDYTSSGSTNDAAQNFAKRQRRGWVKVGSGRDRQDYCPRCAPARADLL